MKVVKYYVDVKVELKEGKNADIEKVKLEGLLKRFTKKKEDKEEPKLTVNDHTIELSGIRFRERIGFRNFVDELAEKYEAKCTPLNEANGKITVQCESDKAKISFEANVTRFKRPKKEGEEKEGESKKEEEAKTSGSSQ
ncbi:hypothetical protein [Acidianus sp. HS-5]|uniref:hypothetical protein n=1 Tax=Acidianus sp. HS-5 TaxID=2886040 RepID=UPI001F365193|nr:hypothetical protein [Acidianus sp. HS-5]BDC17113.1 hypothetical protein HS5_00030 [Acidianus sp. HS-5]